MFRPSLLAGALLTTALAAGQLQAMPAPGGDQTSVEQPQAVMQLAQGGGGGGGGSGGGSGGGDGGGGSGSGGGGDSAGRGPDTSKGSVSGSQTEFPSGLGSPGTAPTAPSTGGTSGTGTSGSTGSTSGTGSGTTTK